MLASLGAHSPRAALHARRHALELLLGRLDATARRTLSDARARSAAAASSLREHSPGAALGARAAGSGARCTPGARCGAPATGCAHRLELAARALGAVSPLATLQRGYAIVRLADGSVVRDAAALAPGTEIRGTLAAGGFCATVTKVDPTT